MWNHAVPFEVLASFGCGVTLSPPLLLSLHDSPPDAESWERRLTPVKRIELPKCLLISAERQDS